MKGSWNHDGLSVSERAFVLQNTLSLSQEMPEHSDSCIWVQKQHGYVSKNSLYSEEQQWLLHWFWQRTGIAFDSVRRHSHIPCAHKKHQLKKVPGPWALWNLGPWPLTLEWKCTEEEESVSQWTGTTGHWLVVDHISSNVSHRWLQAQGPSSTSRYGSSTWLELDVQNEILVQVMEILLKQGWSVVLCQTVSRYLDLGMTTGSSACQDRGFQQSCPGRKRKGLQIK